MLVRRAEGWTVPSARLVLCTSKRLVGELASRYPAAKVLWLPNGVDRAGLPRETSEPFPGFSLAYVGTIYGGRDTGIVVRAVRRLLDREGSPRQVKLRIVGFAEPKHQAALLADVEALGLRDTVEITGPVPRADALRILQRSQAVLVLAQRQPLSVPAKLYEAVALGVPTVVVAERDSASAEEAQAVGALCVEPDDDRGLAAVLAQIQDGRFVRPSIPQRTSYETLSGWLEDVLLALEPTESS
jgi:glycosyltransferase involved in cell wall biosynthesis